MKSLFDQNLSHRLPRRVAEFFSQSKHVREANLDRAVDGAIWDFAKAHGFAIATQDVDFAERSRLHGAPPKVIWLRCGNTRPLPIENLILRNAESIRRLDQDPEIHCIELY